MRYSKRADGRYARQVKVGEVNGKAIKKTIYGKTEKELDKKYRELMLLVDRNVIIETQGITLGELKKEWYRIRIDGKIRRNTECAYSSILKRIEPISTMRVKDIKRYNIESLISDILKEGHENTAQSVLKMLRKIFDYAIDNDIIYKNPCNGLSVKHKQKEKRVLTDSEKDIIDNSEIPLRDKAILYLLRYTGIRRGELFALHKDDIDKKNSIIRINKTLVDNNGKPYIQDMTKSVAGDRCIPIFLKLYNPLFDYLDTVDGYLFLNKKGALMACNSMRTLFDRIKSDYGLGEDLTMHCFRHNFISECYSAKIDVKKTQSWVGHDDVGTTLNIYTKLSRQEIQDGSLMDFYYESQKQVKQSADAPVDALSLVKQAT